MNAPVTTESARTTTLERRFAEFSPEVLAWLALPPHWTYEAAVRAEFPAPDGDLGGLLDAFTRAGLCEAGSATETHAWTLVVHATSEFRSRSTVERGVMNRLGALITGAPAESTAGRVRLSTQQLRLREVDFRCRELRLNDQQGLAEGQRIDLHLRPTIERRGAATGPSATGTVLTINADAWAGRTAIVSLDPSPREQPSLEAWMYRTFSVPRPVRAAVLDYLQNRTTDEGGRGRAGTPGIDLLNTTRTIANRLRGEDWSTPLPGDLRRWRDLAAAAGSWSGGIAEELERQLRPHLASGATAEVQAWLEVAEELVPVFGGRLEAAVRLGRRQLESIWRRAADQRLLQSFLPRVEQIRAFHELLATRDGSWALHYLGVGGVGKTMLLRHITAELVGARPFARIDFDYLSPDYPVRRPGQLLLELADGLRTFGRSDGDTETRFLELRLRMEELHRFAEDVEDEIRKSDPLFALHQTELKFDQLVDDFAAYLRSLQPAAETTADGERSSRVVLLLDTCEELARLQRDGEFQPAVRATFEILERVQARLRKRVDAAVSHEPAAGTAAAPTAGVESSSGTPAPDPTLAVVFAGRRLLATAGDGWRSAHGSGEHSAGDVRPYLRLHVIRGFTVDEATRYLTVNKAPADPGIPPMPLALQRAVRARSRETGDAARVLRPEEENFAAPQATRHDGATPLARASALRQLSPLGGPLQKERERLLRVLLHRTAPLRLERQRVLRVLLQAPGRFNPFDLSFYADWYLEDPALTPETIEQGDADSYVEMRLLHRLHHHVRAALPYLVLLRRCERSLLKEILGHEDATFSPLFDELCQLEWIDYQTELIGNGGHTFLAIDRNLLPRLQRYFGDTPLPSQTEEARLRRRALDTATARLGPLLTGRLQTQPTSEIDTAELIAALRLLPADAAASLWTAIEMKIVAERAWDWAREATDRLLNPEDPVPRAVRAHVRSTRIGARLHAGRATSDREAWLQVQDEAGDCPIPAIRQWLLARAKIACVATVAESSPPDHGLTPGSNPASLDLDAISGESAEQTTFRAQQLVGSYARVMHALTERLDRDRLAREPASDAGADLLRQLRVAATDDSVTLLFDLLLARRLPAESDESAAAFETLRTRLDTASTPQLAPPDWLDWPLPANWLSRLRLEWLHFAPQAATRAQLRQGAFVRWQQQALADVPDDDSALLLSALLSLQLDEQPLLADALAEVESAAAVFPGKPQCNAQRATPALFLTVARGWLARGETRRAVELVLRHLNNPDLDAQVTHEAEAALLVMARRMRDPSIGGSVLARWLNSPRYDELTHAWPVFRLSQPLATPLPYRPPTTTPEVLHASWQVQTALGSEDRREALRVSPDAFESAATHAEASLAMALRLDGLEAARILQDSAASLVDRALGSAATGRLTAQMFRRRLAPRDTLRYTALTQGLLNVPQRAVAVRSVAAVPLLGPRRLNVPEFRARYGSSQMADWALAEGELLVTRVPTAGIFLLDLARETYGSIQDDLGVFMASVGAAGALIHQRKEAEARDWLQKHAVPAYERLRHQRTLSGLEAWPPAEPGEFLVAATTDRSSADLRGWLVRFGAALTFVSKPRTHWENGGWSRWLAEHVTAQSVSFELEFCPPPAPAEMTRTPISAARPAPAAVLSTGPASSRLRWRSFSRVLTIVAVIGGLYGVFAFVRRALFLRVRSPEAPVDDVENTVNAADVLQRPRVLAFFLFVACIVLIARIVRHRARKAAVARAREAALLLAVRPATRGDGVDAVVAWRESSNRGVFPTSPAVRSVPLHLSTQEGREFSIPETVVASLQSAFTGASSDLLGCAVAVAAGQEGASWETQLHGLLPAPPPRVVLYRWLEPTSAPRPGSHQARQVLALGPARWLPLCEQGWRKASRLQFHGSTRSLLRSSPSPERPGILHLVGSMIRVRAGQRLRIGDVGGYGRPSQEVEAALVGPEELPLPTTELVIVHGEPNEIPGLTSTELRELESLRTFAHALFQAGARSVLLLPRLPAQLLEKVIATIATAMAAQPHPTCGDLVTLTQTVRDLVVREWAAVKRPRSAAAAPRAEAYALQLTLFARSRWADPTNIPFSPSS